MSRIGKLPINIPAGVTVTLKDNVVSVKGPKGEMSQKVDPSIIVTIEDNQIKLPSMKQTTPLKRSRSRLSTACTVLW